MANNYVKINELITEVKHNPFRGLCEQTYINDSIYAEFAKRKDLKWVKIQDLRLKYKWTADETQIST
jgi:Txe/YoeB family toxin of Txe-Axe toxin-antitoxin module